jgi:hypothetical protein
MNRKRIGAVQGMAMAVTEVMAVTVTDGQIGAGITGNVIHLDIFNQANGGSGNLIPLT